MVDAGTHRRRRLSGPTPGSLDGPDYVGRDGNVERSLDEQLVDEVRRRPGSPTYAIANGVGLRGQTALVRKRLRRLEDAGRVRSGAARYFTSMISWWAR